MNLITEVIGGAEISIPKLESLLRKELGLSTKERSQGMERCDTELGFWKERGILDKERSTIACPGP